MDTRLFDQNWKQLKPKLRSHWTGLTDSDVGIVDGKCDVLMEVLREKYGYSQMQAESEVNRFLEENIPARV